MKIAIEGTVYVGLSNGVLLAKKNEVLEINPYVILFIKSTVPVGYTKNISKKFNPNNILFSPEFLREGLELHGDIYPRLLDIEDKIYIRDIFNSDC